MKKVCDMTDEEFDNMDESELIESLFESENDKQMDMPITLRNILQNRLVEYIESFGYNNILTDSIEKDYKNQVVFFTIKNEEQINLIEFNEDDFEENWRI
ncbi:MAG TPA: hypothetical protein VMX17_03610 [Candidatus Glassbacteria bacterium]|nr:hypothetical protein [Candidatus Glassbacteria bacterium]